MSKGGEYSELQRVGFKLENGMLRFTCANDGIDCRMVPCESETKPSWGSSQFMRLFILSFKNILKKFKDFLFFILN